jgi:Holliday junction resolvase-like predicted endonuclease
MNIKQRGVAASRAYLERIGHEVLEPERMSMPDGIDILSIDGDILVATLVRVRQQPAEDEPVSGRTLDAALRDIIDHRKSYAPQCDAVRVDVISILVLSEDRALLRHYRGERSG